MAQFELDPITESRLTVKLFRNVQNVPDLRKQLTSGQLQCCFIKPKLILDPFQVVVAANKALTAESFTTKGVFTEILFNLSISKSITKSLQQFGVDDNDKDLLMVTVEKNGQSGDDVAVEIKGDEVDLERLEDLLDLHAIKKTYKIGDEEAKSTTLLDSVVSRIVTKDFVSH